MLADRGRPRALCRRAGGGRGRRRPLSRRGRARTDRGRLQAAAGDRRSARRARCKRSRSLHDGLGSNVVSDRSFRYGDPEAAFAQAARRVSVSINYPRNSCTPIETYGVVAAIRAGRGRLRHSRQFPGAVQPASGDGAGAEGAGQSVAPAHAARFRRQLRRQAGGVSLHRADGRRRARRRPPGEMDRGPARASRRLGVGDQPRHHAAKPRSMPTAACARSPGTRSRTSAPISARRSRRRSTACTAISPAPTTSATSRCATASCSPTRRRPA